MGEFAMQHYSGFHSTMDHRTAIPKPYISYYPAIYPQSSLKTSINKLSGSGAYLQTITHNTTPQPRFEALGKRESYETHNQIDLSTFGSTQRAHLGDILLARSGDKGGNANIGFFIPTALPSSYIPTTLYTETWDWLRSFLTIPKLQELFAESWDDSYHVERVEFPRIWAVHFVVYGVLGRGVSGSSRLDAFAKGMGDWLRDCVVDVPVRFLEGRGLSVNGANGVGGSRL
jgi:hypothetical protein